MGDQHYYPERNALSTRPESQWQFYALFPTLIRNATDVEVRITDADTGKLYYVNDYETFDDYMMASFYYTNAGQWYDTTSDYGVGFDWDYGTPKPVKPSPREPGSASASCAPRTTTSTTTAPSAGTIWVRAPASYEFTVDNTAPKLVGSQPLTLSADGKTLYYTAQDENYRRRGADEWLCQQGSELQLPRHAPVSEGAKRFPAPWTLPATQKPMAIRPSLP